MNKTNESIYMKVNTNISLKLYTQLKRLFLKYSPNNRSGYVTHVSHLTETICNTTIHYLY